MSKYVNLRDDFSTRIKKLMEEFYECSIERELNVSFLLMIATSSFVIPYETMKKEDNDCFENKFSLSLIQSVETLFGYIPSDTIEVYEEYKDDYNKNFKSCKSEFFAIIRNALAHGNILVPASKETDEIEEIVFISENKNSDTPSNKYKFLKFKVNDFKLFLETWLHFLEKNKWV